MNKLFALLLILLGVVLTETVIEEIDEKSPQDIQQEDLKVKKKQTKKLTKEEKAEKIRVKKAQTAKLESCLVMTRSFYQQNEKKFQAYIENHATVASVENEQASK